MQINNDISLVKIIMLIYLFVFINNISTNINRKLVNTINNNIVLKHIIGIISISVMLSLLYKDLSIKELIVYSLSIYFIYILSTKISTCYLLVGLLVLICFYFADYINQNKYNRIKLDKALDIETKTNLIKKIENNHKYLTLFYIGAVVIGALMYDEKKHNQFGYSYTIIKFLD